MFISQTPYGDLSVLELDAPKEALMIESTDVQADVSVLYKLLTPVIASLLAAHYNRLALSRALGDDRNEEEILKEVLSDFLVFSELVEKSITALTGWTRTRPLSVLRPGDRPHDSLPRWLQLQSHRGGLYARLQNRVAPGTLLGGSKSRPYSFLPIPPCLLRAR